MEYKCVGKAILLDFVDGESNKRVLAVGDMHLGYEGSLQASGYLVLSEILDSVIGDFDKIFGKIGNVDEIVLLGDLKNDFGRISDQEWRDILKLFDYLSKKGKVIVVKGNHDKMLEPVAWKRKIEVKDYYIVGSVGFLHGDRDFSEVENCEVWVVGHGHPAVNLKEGVKEEKYKCFLVGKFKGRKVIVLPSFLPVREGSDPRDYDLGFAWPLKLKEFDVGIVDGVEVRWFGRLGGL
jgi:uncharacterized protein